MFTYPDIDPVALSLGPLDIRWYSLAYIAGLLFTWWFVAREHTHKPIHHLSKKALDDVLMWAVFGVLIGGRLGHVMFYQPDYYLAHPLEIVQVWHGGMSFHGGLLGVIVAFYLYCKKYKIHFLEMMDVIAVSAPIGLFFGRLANFINGELWGRVTSSEWGMVFPSGGPLPRHPSQLYEATMEGALLFVLLFATLKYTAARHYRGLLSGLFLLGYGIARSVGELFREPDAIVYGSITIGQALSFPMIALGIFLIVRSKTHVAA